MRIALEEPNDTNATLCSLATANPAGQASISFAIGPYALIKVPWSRTELPQ